MAVLAVLRIVGAHASPLHLRHAQTVSFEFFRCPNRAAKLMPEFVQALNLAEEEPDRIGRVMAISTARPNAGWIDVVHRLLPLRDHVMRMAAGAEFVGAGKMHGYGKEAASANADHEPDHDQDQERPARAWAPQEAPDS